MTPSVRESIFFARRAQQEHAQRHDVQLELLPQDVVESWDRARERASQKRRKR